MNDDYDKGLRGEYMPNSYGNSEYEKGEQDARFRKNTEEWVASLNQQTQNTGGGYTHIGAGHGRPMSRKAAILILMMLVAPLTFMFVAFGARPLMAEILKPTRYSIDKPIQYKGYDVAFLGGDHGQFPNKHGLNLQVIQNGRLLWRQPSDWNYISSLTRRPTLATHDGMVMIKIYGITRGHNIVHVCLHMKDGVAIGGLPVTQQFNCDSNRIKWYPHGAPSVEDAQRLIEH
jgi:hypothetical protein